ncbi:PAB-dependent poly(A)-specific ribonuclease subunit PAN2 [Coleophoma crateriformis]|uniref:PAN2-PAN3 deadenylation complex catalytic subunit PAN2 n=1 Tax=Coleophoma crateriformis TaxID=565419 RepID=A0A3D8SH58_9HELO|nr:PAB-dependent poly(A)-specific ribonuclease subunit PAN2 [Coleophoma crateriformis]
MDADWEEVARLALPPPGLNALQTPVKTTAFDTHQELLWTGNEYGRVTSFYGTELQRYTSFKAGEGPVRQLLFHDKGIVALTPRAVHMSMRRGPPLWHIAHEEMKDLQCMSYTSKGTSEILVAGIQDVMFVIDVNKGTITKQIHTSDHYMKMQRSRYICGATKTGTVNILDSITFNVIKTWTAHSALVSDMDAQHDFIVTCGFSIRQLGNYMLDPLVNVFDLKNMKPLPPIPFPAGAAYVRLHPRMSTTCIVVGQTGQMHIVDLMNVNTSNVKQANCLTYLTYLEIAPSGEAIALVDAECNIHLWGSPSRIRFAEFSNPVDFPDPIDEVPTLDWSPDTPLSSIGMPYYREQLLSGWPSHMIFEVGAPPVKMEQQPLPGFKTAEWGSYGRNPRGVRRNQIENTRAIEKKNESLQAPRFLSEKAREAANDASSERRISDASESLSALDLSKSEIPRRYRNVEIKYSKFGVDDFDFGYYNKTSYSGLEIHISNSYANPLLQLMHFTPIIRNMALQHTATSCSNELCLLCEMGFLFDMLEKAEGSICQATNMLKTLSCHREAGPLGLLEEETPGSSLTAMLQGLNRFLLDKIVQDFRSIPPRSTALDQVLATPATTAIRCMNCRSEHTRPGTTFVNELIYPVPKIVVRNPRTPKLSFSQILKSSVERETTSRGWCSRCQRYQSLQTRKTIHNIPAVLMLNAAVNSPEAKQFWSTPGWLPDEIGVIVDQGQFFCYQGEDLKLHLQRGIHNVIVYSLVGLAADIENGPNQKSHLISLINVGHSKPTPPTESQWHLFNDFLVAPVSKDEALAFNTTWKVPSVLAYQIKAANNQIDNTWKQNLDTSLLYIDHNRNPGPKTYRPLVPPQEAPTEGTIVALDTEFVAIRQPEIEMNSDGERETIRPIVYALARVSVVRGSGEDEGLPFIDDYVKSKETVVDFLTSYSGIVPSDLDPRVSKHNLLPLKIAYKKLWILLNLGCKFLGHGLKQDFRVTNIHVPKSQVIDTIDFFYVKSRLRKLSLAFLAWYFLKEDIQLETHDSIEDARTALKLYRKYQEFNDAGILETMLNDIYSKGRETNFKPPPPPKSKGAPEILRTETPPILSDGSLSAAALEGPTTPVRKPISGLLPGSAGTGGFGSGGWTPGRGSGLGGSPLR